MSRDLSPYARKRWLLRQGLYKRQRGRCWHCREKMEIRLLEVDEQPTARYATFEHLVSKRAGNGRRRKVVLACRDCNWEKNDEETAWLNYQAQQEQEDA